MIFDIARCPVTIAPIEVNSDRPQTHSSAGDNTPRIRLVIASGEVCGGPLGAAPGWGA